MSRRAPERERDAPRVVAGTHPALPVAVLALFLWWLLALPPYPQGSELPIDWTPECPRWTCHWQRCATPQQWDAEVRLVALDPTPPAALILHRAWSYDNGILLRKRADGATEPKPLSAAASVVQAVGGELLELDPPGLRPPVLRWRDMTTFELLRTLPLQSEVATGGAGLHTDWAWRYPDGTMRAILYWYVVNARHSALVDVQPDGRCRTLTTWRSHQTPHQIAYSSAGQPESVLVPADSADHRELRFDLRTGAQQVRKLPNPPNPWDEPEPRERVARLPAGCFDLSWDDPDGDLDFDFSAPVAFLDPGELSWLAYRSKWQQWGQRAAMLRGQLWRLLHGKEAVAARSLDAIRVDRVALIDPTHPDGARPITNLRRTLHAALIQQARVEQEAAAQRSGSPEPDLSLTRLATLFGDVNTLAAYPLGENRFLIREFVTHSPLLSENQWLARFGVLEPDATEVAWVGWCKLPDGVPPTMPMSRDLIRLWRLGDQLLITTGGISQLDYHLGHIDFADFYWCTVALPDTLRDLLTNPEP